MAWLQYASGNGESVRRFVQISTHTLPKSICRAFHLLGWKKKKLIKFRTWFRIATVLKAMIRKWVKSRKLLRNTKTLPTGIHPFIKYCYARKFCLHFIRPRKQDEISLHLFARSISFSSLSKFHWMFPAMEIFVLILNHFSLYILSFKNLPMSLITLKFASTFLI